MYFFLEFLFVSSMLFFMCYGCLSNYFHFTQFFSVLALEESGLCGFDFLGFPFIFNGFGAPHGVGLGFLSFLWCLFENVVWEWTLGDQWMRLKDYYVEHFL